MKKKIFIRAVYISVLLVLLGGCIYFYNKSKNLEFNVLIGTPTSDVLTVYGDKVKDNEVVDLINLGLINAVSIEKPKIANNLPNATFLIFKDKPGYGSLHYELWIENNQVIAGIGNKETTGKREYKKIVDSFNEDFINLISKYKLKES